MKFLVISIAVSCHIFMVIFIEISYDLRIEYLLIVDLELLILVWIILVDKQLILTIIRSIL